MYLCTVKELPLELSRLTRLTELDVSGNALAELPPGCLFALTKLRVLGLSHNRLGACPQVSGGWLGPDGWVPLLTMGASCLPKVPQVMVGGPVSYRLKKEQEKDRMERLYGKRRHEMVTLGPWSPPARAFKDSNVLVLGHAGVYAVPLQQAVLEDEVELAGGDTHTAPHSHPPSPTRPQGDTQEHTAGAADASPAPNPSAHNTAQPTDGGPPPGALGGGQQDGAAAQPALQSKPDVCGELREDTAEQEEQTGRTTSQMLPSLTRLALASNTMTHIPPWLPQSLVSLDLSHNLVRWVPAWACNRLTTLTHLALHANRIQHVAAEAATSLVSLHSVSLEDNLVTDVAAVESLGDPGWGANLAASIYKSKYEKKRDSALTGPTAGTGLSAAGAHGASMVTGSAAVDKEKELQHGRSSTTGSVAAGSDVGIRHGTLQPQASNASIAASLVGMGGV